VLQDLWIWRDEAVAERLSWYLAVSTNRVPAKFLICRRTPVDVELDASEEELWSAHREAATRFDEARRAVRRGELRLSEMERPRRSLMDLKVELVKRMLRHCNFCRWNCGVDRVEGGKRGACMLDRFSRVSSYFHHMGEELPIRGLWGSGTIFFTSCNMRCGFCLHPDSYVLTVAGPVRIKDLFTGASPPVWTGHGQVAFPEGLYVYTSDGRPAAVAKIFRHDYAGVLVSVETTYTPPLLLTPSHRVPIYKSGGVVKVRASGLREGDCVLVPVLHHLGSFEGHRSSDPEGRDTLDRWRAEWAAEPQGYTLVPRGLAGCGRQPVYRDGGGRAWCAPPETYGSGPLAVETLLEDLAEASVGRARIFTTSLGLAMDLYALLLMRGQLPRFEACGGYTGSVPEGQHRLYKIEAGLDAVEGAEAGAGFVAVPIRRISRIKYRGPVYNLEVDDDQHTYVANFIGVGNCQNGDISRDKDNGLVVDPELLAMMMWELRVEGCHNINLVGGEPTIHLHTIVEGISLLGSVKPARDRLAYLWAMKPDALSWRRLEPAQYIHEGEFNTPILWNSNMYMSPEALEILREIVDIWLPDFKFGSNACSIRLSRTPWYWETVTRNHKTIYDWGEDILVRHLVMPNHVECCTKKVLSWIAENMPGVPVNVMDQYHPDCSADQLSPYYDPRYAEISRRPTSGEIRESYRFAKKLGLVFESISLEKNVSGLRP